MQVELSPRQALIDALDPCFILRCVSELRIAFFGSGNVYSSSHPCAVATWVLGSAAQIEDEGLPCKQCSKFCALCQ